MVFEDGGELLHGQVADSGANSFEGIVIGHEGSDVHGRVEGTDEAGVIEGTNSGAEASSDSGGGDVDWYSQDGVDDVNDTSGEVDVLIRFMSVETQCEHELEKLHTAWVTVEFWRRPEKMETFCPTMTASTRCPPVTLEYAMLLRLVGTKVALLLNIDAW